MKGEETMKEQVKDQISIFDMPKVNAPKPAKAPKP
jgi:hypothetical protein